MRRNSDLYWSMCLYKGVKYYRDLIIYSCFRTKVDVFCGFFEKRQRALPTITYPASLTLVIRRSRVLKKEILWRLEVVVRQCSAKRAQGKSCVAGFFHKVAGLQLGTLSKRDSGIGVATFLQKISEQLLLEEHWILLQTLPIAIAKQYF